MIDAAVIGHDSGQAFLFRGDTYARYDVSGDAISSGPTPITDGWSKLAGTDFAGGIDAAARVQEVSLLRPTRSFAYLFKGDKYAKYALDRGNEMPTAPTSIGDAWPGFRDIGFDRDIDCATDVIMPETVASSRHD
ncbi:hemopexin repeat-containing protein [Streptosporangium sp. V21-05]|uniref:hemopexin repeat-containing protein n=1 Tax=Streptosporangium sp. V21-05 TaxID=3446115 RepID=UPI003F53CA0B